MENEHGQTIYTGGCNNGWGNWLGAGFGGFLGAILGNGGFFGNGNNGGAAVAAAAQGTDSLSRQLLAGQQEAQLMGNIAGVNSRIDSLSDQIASTNAQTLVAGGFADVNANINSFSRQMSDCCCQQKLATVEQGYQNQLANCQQTNTLQAGFANIGYLIQQQGQMLAANDTANTQKVLDWLCNSKQLEQATTIQQLRDEVGRLNQTQNIIDALKTTTAAGA